jgi:GNAT superfamily N-acetyltransferase
MADLLVKLYELPALAPELAKMAARGISIERANGFDRRRITAWVEGHFGEGWRGETDAALSRLVPTCFVASEALPHQPEPGNPYSMAPRRILGFACYDVVKLGMFGPTGVDPERQGHGIGTALLLATLHAMWDAGYGYCQIGWAGPVAWYQRVCGATPIEGSAPGVFKGQLG